MPERDLPWPPERPPRYADVKKAWAELHRETIAHLKRIVPVGNHETRALLKVLRPRELHTRIVTEAGHAEDAFGSAVDDDVDFRPHFNPESADPEAASYDMEGDDEDEGGDLAMVNAEYYSADTRFCVAMSLQWRETRVPTDPDSVGIVEYEYRRLSMHPDTAAYLVSRLSAKCRKTLADALVFQLIRDDGEQLADEETDDGGVAPEWRNRTNDPARDALLICTHLRELYAELVGDE